MLAYVETGFPSILIDAKVNATTAELARQGNVDAALDLVPKHSRIDEIMTGRRTKASIDSHHTATKEWAEELLRNTGRPEYQNLTRAQWDEVLDDMPAYLMDLAFHREGGSTVPKVRDLTAVIRDTMKGVKPEDSPEVLTRLKRAYDEWDQTLGGDPNLNLGDDIWTVARAWLTKKGVQ